MAYPVNVRVEGLQRARLGEVRHPCRYHIERVKRSPAGSISSMILLNASDNGTSTTLILIPRGLSQSEPE